MTTTATSTTGTLAVADTGTTTGTSQPETPTYETKRELATRLCVSGRTINNWMNQGLPYQKFSTRLLRFPRVAVDAWLNSHQISRG